MLENRLDIKPEDLISTVSQMKLQGCRFVTASCADNRDGSFSLYYHFDKDLSLTNLALTVTPDTPIPSITALYMCAFLVENELKELFGLNITDIAIDYEGRMFLSADAPEAPMTYGANIIIEKKEKE